MYVYITDKDTVLFFKFRIFCCLALFALLLDKSLFHVFARSFAVLGLETAPEREGVVETALFCKIANGGVGAFALQLDEMRQPQFVEQG